jgi:hypothetical protein
MKKSKFWCIILVFLGASGVITATQKIALSQEPPSSPPAKVKFPIGCSDRVDTSVDRLTIFQELVFISASGVYCSETRLLRDGRLIEFPGLNACNSQTLKCNFKSSEGKLIRIISQSEMKAFQKFLVNHYFRNFDGRYKSYSQCKDFHSGMYPVENMTLNGERGSITLDKTTFSCPGNRLPLDLRAILNKWRSFAPPSKLFQFWFREMESL